MGTLFSCFTRTRTRSTSSLKYSQTPLNSTPISHPYPLAARQRAMSEYNRPFTPTPTPLVPLSPTVKDTPTRKHHAASTTTSRCSSPSSPSQRAVPRGPKRVHEIPFPLLLNHSVPSSPHALSPASSLRPLAPALVSATRAPQGDMASVSSTTGRRKLRKVQLVDGGWELWRQDDWGGYDGTSKPEKGRGQVVPAHEGGKAVGYEEGDISPLISLPIDPDSVKGSAMNRGIRALSGDTIVAEQALAKGGTT